MKYERPVELREKIFLDTHVVERWGNGLGCRGMARMKNEQQRATRIVATAPNWRGSAWDPLTRNFRLAIREMMSKDEIKAIIEERFVKELRGEVPRLIIPEVFATARGFAAEDQLVTTQAYKPQRFPDDGIFRGWTSDEKIAFYCEGTVPERYKT
jgi:hypothetical protein